MAKAERLWWQAKVAAEGRQREAREGATHGSCAPHTTPHNTSEEKELRKPVVVMYNNEQRHQARLAFLAHFSAVP